MTVQRCKPPPKRHAHFRPAFLEVYAIPAHFPNPAAFPCLPCRDANRPFPLPLYLLRPQFSVLRYESVIHEFDPYFNYRSTIKLVTEGFYEFWK